MSQFLGQLIALLQPSLSRDTKRHALPPYLSASRTLLANMDNLPAALLKIFAEFYPVEKTFILLYRFEDVTSFKDSAD